jgi:cell division protein FtsQ
MPPKRKRNLKKKILSLLLATGTAVAAVYVFFERIERGLLDCIDTIVRGIGFRVENINIIGGNDKTVLDIRTNLKICKNDNIFKLSAKDMYEDVVKSRWVKFAIVRKNLPNSITITVQETSPIAIFQHDSIAELISEDGRCIEKVTTNQLQLPVVSGDKANENAHKILKIIAKYEIIAQGLESLVFIRERRWDMYVSGIKIKLPEQDIERAMNVLVILLRNRKINKTTTKTIDLRTSDSIIFGGLKLKNPNKRHNEI